MHFFLDVPRIDACPRSTVYMALNGAQADCILKLASACHAAESARRGCKSRMAWTARIPGSSRQLASDPTAASKQTTPSHWRTRTSCIIQEPLNGCREDNQRGGSACRWPDGQNTSAFSPVAVLTSPAIRERLLRGR